MRSLDFESIPLLARNQKVGILKTIVSQLRNIPKGKKAWIENNSWSCQLSFSCIVLAMCHFRFLMFKALQSMPSTDSLSVDEAPED